MIHFGSRLFLCLLQLSKFTGKEDSLNLQCILLYALAKEAINWQLTSMYIKKIVLCSSILECIGLKLVNKLSDKKMCCLHAGT